VLKEKQDYERMQTEQKKLEQEMADTLKRRSRHTSSENEGWMEFGGKPKPFEGPRCHALKNLRITWMHFYTDLRSTQKLNIGEEISGQCIYQLC